MGCSNPHPHCQVWSSSTIPTIIATEFTHLRQYAQGLTDGCAADLLPLSEVSLQGISHAHMLLDYANFEIHGISLDQGRVVLKNEHWVAIVPWWATWPFELLGEAI
jgi:UDPglucose--hexose-1-phosphate uridylyltransferase